MLADLLNDPKNPWWDDRSTPNVVEDRDMILRESLLAAYERVVRQYGPPGAAWQWSNVRFANIQHLLRIPALSRLNIPMASGPGTLSPSGGDGNHGSSWRMVVELGPEVRAWGTYPGRTVRQPVEQALRRPARQVGVGDARHAAVPASRRGTLGAHAHVHADPHAGAPAMTQLARLLLLTAAFAIATFAAGWWAVPLAAAAYAAMTSAQRSSAVIAGLAAMLSWGVLLGITAAQGPVGTLATELGGVLNLGSSAVYAVTIAFPGLLAVSAAVVARALASARSQAAPSSGPSH